MSHAVAACLHSDNVTAAVYVPTQQLAEDGEAILSSDEASASGIATIWLLFNAVEAVIGNVGIARRLSDLPALGQVC